MLEDVFKPHFKGTGQTSCTTLSVYVCSKENGMAWASLDTKSLVLEGTVKSLRHIENSTGSQPCKVQCRAPALKSEPTTQLLVVVIVVFREAWASKYNQNSLSWPRVGARLW